MIDKTREFKVPEEYLFDSTDECLKYYPEDAVCFVVSKYDYDKLQAKLKRQAKAIGVLKEGLANIENHGYMCRAYNNWRYEDAYPKEANITLDKANEILKGLDE